MPEFTGSISSCGPYEFFCYIQWAIDQYLATQLYLFEMVLMAFVTVMEIIPVPSWLENAAGMSAIIPPEITYFTDLFMLPTGLSFAVSAYTLRFLIRRIPVIG